MVRGLYPGIKSDKRFVCEHLKLQEVCMRTFKVARGLYVNI